MVESYSSYKDFLDNAGPPDDLNSLYAYLLFIQVYSLLLHYLYWFSDLDYGQKERERRQNASLLMRGLPPSSAITSSGEYIACRDLLSAVFIQFLSRSYRKSSFPETEEAEEEE